MWQGDLVRIPLGGGKVERVALIAPGISPFEQHDLALTDTAVIFIQHPATDPGNARILSAPLAGGKTALLAEANGAAGFLAVDAQNVYFADTEGVESVSLSGGTVRTLAPVQCDRCGGHVGVGSLRPVSDQLYFATNDAIHSVPTSGGDVTKVADGGSRSLIACGGKSVCWVSDAPHAALLRFALGGVPQVLAGVPEPLNMVFDGTDFFLTLARPGELVRAPVSDFPDGGTADAIYVDEGLNSVALTDTCLFWSSASTIMGVSLGAAHVSSWAD